MLTFILGFLAGALVGGLVYRNNAKKAQVALDALVVKYEEVEKKVVEEVKK